MPQINATIKVDAPADVLFRTVEAPPAPLLPDQAPRLVRLGQPFGPGAVYRWEFRRLGLNFRVESVVDQYDPPRRICFRGLSGWNSEAEVQAVPDPDGGARLLFRMQYRFDRPLCWLIPGTLIRLGIWHGIRQVKSLAEARASKQPLPPTAKQQP